MKTAYRIKNTRESSQKLGNCEVCHKYAPEVHLLTIYDGVRDPETDKDFFAQKKVIFGHKNCLAQLTEV